MSTAFASAYAIGLFIALPIGPVALTCLGHTIRTGLRAGLLGGLGAATAHGIFAALSCLGAATMSEVASHWQRPVALASATILVVIGLSHLHRWRRMRGPARPPAPGPARAAYLGCLALALGNPLTILPYLAAAQAFASAASVGSVAEAALGAACGALSWYGAIILPAALSRRTVLRGVADRLDIISGLAMIGFGCLLASGHA